MGARGFPTLKETPRVCASDCSSQALAVTMMTETGSISQRRRAVAASALLLIGAIAIIAVMSSPDADQSATVERLSATSEETSLSNAPVMAKVDHFDSMRAWATARTQAKRVAHVAKRLKSSATKANKLLKKKRKDAKKKLGKANQKQKGQQHKKHVKLRAAAAQRTAAAVKKAMKNVMGGVNSLAAKAATNAAKSVVEADAKKKAAAEKAERIAEVKEGKLQHMVDRLGYLRRRIRSIQLKEISVRRKAKEKAKKYAKHVRDHVERAKKHFEAMRRLLKQFRKAVADTKRDKASIRRMVATLAVLHKHIKKAQADLQNQVRLRHKERRQKRRAHEKFAQKKRRTKRRYKKLIHQLRMQIKEEKYRNSRPDRNGQLRLNNLNVKSQTLLVKLNENMKEIAELKKRLKKARAANSVMAKKAHKRKIVLKVAQSAYRHLNNAVKRLKKIVLLNKEHDKVISEKPVGLDFTKKLLHTVGKSVKKAVKKAKKAGIRHLKKAHTAKEY